MEWNNRWSWTNIFHKKILAGAFFLWLLLPTFFGWYKLFSIDWTIWQHAVILESIWETASIIIFFPASRRDSSLLFRLALLYSSSPFYSHKLLQVQLRFSLLPFGQKFSKSKFLFSLRKKNVLSPTSILQKYSKTIPNLVFAAESFQSYKIILSPILFFWLWKNPSFCLPNFIRLPLEFKQCPLTLASALACADSVDEF